MIRTNNLYLGYTKFGRLAFPHDKASQRPSIKCMNNVQDKMCFGQLTWRAHPTIEILKLDVRSPNKQETRTQSYSNVVTNHVTLAQH